MIAFTLLRSKYRDLLERVESRINAHQYLHRAFNAARSGQQTVGDAVRPQVPQHVRIGKPIRLDRKRANRPSGSPPNRKLARYGIRGNLG